MDRRRARLRDLRNRHLLSTNPPHQRLEGPDRSRDRDMIRSGASQSIVRGTPGTVIAYGTLAMVGAHPVCSRLDRAAQRPFTYRRKRLVACPPPKLLTARSRIESEGAARTRPAPGRRGRPRRSLCRTDTRYAGPPRGTPDCLAGTPPRHPKLPRRDLPAAPFPDLRSAVAEGPGERPARTSGSFDGARSRPHTPRSAPGTFRVLRSGLHLDN
jgi:hypothetical protein